MRAGKHATCCTLAIEKLGYLEMGLTVFSGAILEFDYDNEVDLNIWGWAFILP
jgi:hypothetical protein